MTRRAVWNYHHEVCEISGYWLSKRVYVCARAWGSRAGMMEGDAPIRDDVQEILKKLSLNAASGYLPISFANTAHPSRSFPLSSPFRFSSPRPVLAYLLFPLLRLSFSIFYFTYFHFHQTIQKERLLSSPLTNFSFRIALESTSIFLLWCMCSLSSRREWWKSYWGCVQKSLERMILFSWKWRVDEKEERRLDMSIVMEKREEDIFRETK